MAWIITTPKRTVAIAASTGVGTRTSIMSNLMQVPSSISRIPQASRRIARAHAGVTQQAHIVGIDVRRIGAEDRGEHAADRDAHQAARHPCRRKLLVRPFADHGVERHRRDIRRHENEHEEEHDIRPYFESEGKPLRCDEPRRGDDGARARSE